MGMISFSLQVNMKATDQGAERARQEPGGLITFKIRSWWSTSTWQVPLPKGSTPSKHHYQLGMKARAWGGTWQGSPGLVLSCEGSEMGTPSCEGVHPLVEGYTRLWRGTPAPSQALSLSIEDLNIHAWTYVCEAQLPPLKGNNTVYSEPHISGCGLGARIQAVPNGMLQHGSSHTNFFWLQNKVRAFTKCAEGGAK